MKVVIKAIDFHWAGVMYKYRESLKRALESLGVPVRVDLVDVAEGKPRGAFTRPVRRQLFDRYTKAAGELVLASSVRVAYRGTDVAALHVSVGWDERSRDLRDRVEVFLNRAAIRHARLLLVNTEADHRFVRALSGEQAVGRCRTLGQAVDSSIYHPSSEPRPFAAAWIGNSTESKQPLVFLEAMQRLPELRAFMTSRPHDRFPALHAQVKELADRLPNVEFREGSVPEEELATFLRRSRSVVSTSRYEGFHVPMMEGAFSGAWPVVPDQEPYPSLFLPSEAIRYAALRRAPFGPPVAIDYTRELEGAIREAAGRPPLDPSRLRGRHDLPAFANTLRSVLEEAGRR